MVTFGSNAQDFAKQVPVEKTRRPTGFYKQLGLDAATIISALWFSFAYQRYIENTTPLLVLVVVSIIFAIFSGLQAFMPQSLNRRIMVIILEAIALVAFFISTSGSRVFTLFFPLLLVFFIWGEILAKRDRKNSLRIRYFQTAQKQLGKVMTGLTLAVVIIFIPHLDVEKIFVPHGAYNTFFNLFASVTKRIYPEIDLRLSVGEVSKDIAELKLVGTDGFKELPLDEKEVVITRSSAELLKQVNKSLEIKIKRTQPVSDLFLAVITATLEDWQIRFGDAFLVGWGIIFFFIVRSIAVIIGWLGAFFGYLVFQFLQTINFVHAIGENSMQEVVEY